MICSKTYQQSVVIHYLLLRNPPNPSTLRIRRIILRHSVVCKGSFKKYRRVSWKCACISALYLGCCFPTSPRLIQSMRLAVSNCKKDPGLDQLGNPLLLDTFLLLIICIMDNIRSNFLAPYWKFPQMKRIKKPFTLCISPSMIKNNHLDTVRQGCRWPNSWQSVSPAMKSYSVRDSKPRVEGWVCSKVWYSSIVCCWCFFISSLEFSSDLK